MVSWRLLPWELAAVSFSDFIKMANALEYVQYEECLSAQRNAAFTAWLSGAGGDKTWLRFCEHLGLVSRSKDFEAENKLDTARIHKMADRVAENFKTGAQGLKYGKGSI